MSSEREVWVLEMRVYRGRSWFSLGMAFLSEEHAEREAETLRMESRHHYRASRYVPAEEEGDG